MSGVFPIWGADTIELAHSFVKQGFRAIVVCVDTQTLDPAFAGREFDESFLSDLPPDVDRCGENGEFHTFVYDGPIFHKPLRIRRGESVRREERFEYCDLVIAPTQEVPHA
jgi:diphthamide synthase (EF-2-diphthine--ammonia ligase)